MLLCNVFVIFAALVFPTTADLFPRLHHKSNVSEGDEPSNGPDGPVPICCFAVQDVISEEWWGITKISSVFKVVKHSIYTAHVSSWPGITTTTSYELNVKTVNLSFPFTIQIGRNPISLFPNAAYTPVEVTHSNNGTALITGGVRVQSPAAFYVYSTIKIITAEAVLGNDGSWACATSSGGFNNMNQNAQAYFGAPFVKARTATPPVIGRDRPTPKDSQPTPTVISLTTPFIYQPERGRTGATDVSGVCTKKPGTEDYGYVPQTVLDYLASNPFYAAQVQGLASCLPAGPEIKSLACGQSVFTFTSTFTSTPPLTTILRTTTTHINSTITFIRPGFTSFRNFTSLKSSLVTSTIGGSTFQSLITDSSEFEVTGTNFNATFISRTSRLFITSTIVTAEASTITTFRIVPSFFLTSLVVPPKTISNFRPMVIKTTVQVPFQPAPTVVTSTGVEILPPGQLQPQPDFQTPEGTDLTDVETVFATPPGIIKDPVKVQPTGAAETAPKPGENPGGNPGGNPGDKPGSTPGDKPGENPGGDPGDKPAGDRPGAKPETKDHDIAQAICRIAGSCPTKDSGPVPKGNVQSSPGVNIIVPTAPTTVPVKVAPPGLPGTRTEVDGTNVIVVPSPTTFVVQPTREPDKIVGAKATIVNGSPVLVIPSATRIPVVNAPPGLQAPMTVIDNTPFFAIPGRTTIPVPPGNNQFSGSTRVVDGTPFIVIPGSTRIPVASAPLGITGSLTIISNTPFLVVPGSTNIPVITPTGVNGGVGSMTIVDGKPMLVIPSATRIPLSNAPSGLSGSTTTIDGVPFLVVPGATRIPVPAFGPGSPAIGSTTLVNGTPFLVIPSSTQIPVANAPPELRGASTITVDGTPFLVIPSGTILPIPTSQPSIPGAKTSVIDGTPVLVFPSATRIPLSLVSNVPGAKTTLIDGTPFVVIPGPTTVADLRDGQVTAFPKPIPGAETTLIDGTPFLIFPSATRIPLSEASNIPGAKTTTINGTPFLVIPGPTTVADLRDAQVTTFPKSIPGAETTLIDGTPFLIFPSATRIPLSIASNIPGAKTTTINGTPFLVIPGPTTVADPMVTAFMPGQFTVIDGTTRLIIDGPTTVPVDPRFSVSGRTTVINGVTEVVITGDTTVAFETGSNTKTASTRSPTNTKTKSKTRSSSSTPSISSSTTTTSSSTSTFSTSSPTSSPPPEAQVDKLKKGGLSTGAKVGIAFAVLAAVGAAIAAFVLWRRRRMGRYASVPVTRTGE